MTESPNESAATEPPAETPRKKKNRLAVILGSVGTAIAATAAIWAAVVTGVFNSFNKDTTPTPAPTTSTSASPVACNGFRVEVLYPKETGPQPNATFTVRCAPEPGRQFVWIVEAEDISADHHKEYYPKAVLPSQPGATVTYPIDVSKDAIGQVNCVYVISATAAQLTQLQGNIDSHNLTLHLPDGIQRESQAACGRRQY